MSAKLSRAVFRSRVRSRCC